jgi:ATP-dependent RNA helicase DDX19/DBP5
VKLADLQADPNSPLFSVKRFEDLGLSEDLQKGLYAMKFQKPSKIQEKALPLLIHNPPQNLIAQSQSGTGKTAAFALTMLTRVDPTIKDVQAICLSPTRELAKQTLDVIDRMGKYTKVTTALMVPGSFARGEPVKANILVGTAGTLVDQARRKIIKLDKLKVLVLDEADNMLEAQGMGDQCTRFKRMIPASSNYQIALFSATFPDEVMAYAHKFVPKANEIRLQATELNVAQIKQMFMDCDSEEQKFEVLESLYGALTIGSSIIFVRRKDTANILYKKMTMNRHAVSILHSDLENEDRDRLMEDFKSGKSKVLITTNVLARGIDIASVTMVVNYDLPVDKNGKPDPSTYLHRIGRTGRFGRVGIAVSFIHDKESYDVLNAIMEYFGDTVKLHRVGTDDLEQLEEDVLAIVKGKDSKKEKE